MANQIRFANMRKAVLLMIMCGKHVPDPYRMVMRRFVNYKPVTVENVQELEGLVQSMFHMTYEEFLRSNAACDVEGVDATAFWEGLPDDPLDVDATQNQPRVCS